MMRFAINLFRKEKYPYILNVGFFLHFNKSSISKGDQYSHNMATTIEPP